MDSRRTWRSPCRACLPGARGAVQIFDCVEFNRDVRCADVASDLAFLLMDLTRFGAHQIAVTLLARYRAAGLELPDELLRFYSAHRALVRAKIACLRFRAPSREAAVNLRRRRPTTLTSRPLRRDDATDARSS